jgi:hypothetical protein
VVRPQEPHAAHPTDGYHKSWVGICYGSDVRPNRPQVIRRILRTQGIARAWWFLLRVFEVRGTGMIAVCLS